MSLTFGSLFAGIGGFDLGLERAGLRCLWQVEIDPFCREVLEKHWPQVQRYEDVRQVGATNLEPVDVICGGFPCQDLSVAGKGAGLSGSRSGLWFEYARILSELRPAYAIIENVPALRSRGLGRVLKDLEEIGYDAEWHCVPASAIGANHQRDRIWIVAHAGGQRSDVGAQNSVREECLHNQHRNCARNAPGWPQQQSWIAGSGADVAHPNQPRSQGRHSQILRQRPCEWVAGQGGALGYAEKLQCNVSGVHEASHREGTDTLSESRIASAANAGSHPWWRTEPNVGRVAHGVPRRVDRLRALGNAVVPQIVEWIGSQLLEYHYGRPEASAV